MLLDSSTCVTYIIIYITYIIDMTLAFGNTPSRMLKVSQGFGERTNSLALVPQRTIPTEGPPLVEISANVCG
jgi:hypothetical protein